MTKVTEVLPSSTDNNDDIAGDSLILASSDEDVGVVADQDAVEHTIDTSSSTESNSNDDERDDNDDQGSSAKNDERSENDSREEEDDEEEDELWDLKVIFSSKDIDKPNPIRCSTDSCSLVACSVWASTLDPEKPWYACLDCQGNDFGGWPNADELPLKILTEEHARVMMEKCTDDPENAELPQLPRPLDDIDTPAEVAKSEEPTEEVEARNDEDDQEEQLETWDLKIIFNAKDLTKKKPVLCATDDCDLVACSTWVSNHNPDEPWFTCLDCQLEDYGGFPETTEELPVKYLTDENRRLILEKCTEDSENADLPNLPTSLSLAITAGKDDKKYPIISITPPPGYAEAVIENQSNVIVGALHAKGAGSSKKSVTPCPQHPSGASKNASRQAAAQDIARAPSKEALAIHRKWQAEAEKHGGTEARIVVSKPAAKKLIFDKLHDKFRPMNITEIYQELKAVVPSPILKACLDDMSNTFQGGNPFDDNSDDDEDRPSKKPKKNSITSDEYTGSLHLKEGRNINNNLYYVDHTKLQNNGNGLDPDKKNELHANLEKSKCELEAMTQSLKEATAETARLVSEPLNEHLTSLLAEQENKMAELNSTLETNRAFAGNEKYAKQLIARVSKMATVWRKRKRQCVEFLMLMEESTEGSISLKKCLSGDGQICIDSDESVLMGALTFAKKKNTTTVAAKNGMKARNRTCGGNSVGLCPDTGFVGVKLNSNGLPERVYLDDD